ncbi:hypothetical protein BKA63DRAFT_566816 [Paraphoma chrysanthemicola]|nr:hypothetical protein BKA63DRAFT_566816 [Paraphoma chrysanthemicola]
MSFQVSNHDHLRNRKPQSYSDGPPVPPKGPLQGTSVPQPFIQRVTFEQAKPLPPVPTQVSGAVLGGEVYKPLPAPPASVSFRSTLLWIAGFVLWFLLIVVLLPVVTEKDAMPAFNRWLRNIWS